MLAQGSRRSATAPGDGFRFAPRVDTLPATVIVHDTLRSRALLLALAFAGVLAGHVIAYAGQPAHLHADGSAHAHGYLPGLSAVVIPLAVAALVAIAVEELRTGERIVAVGRLALLQGFIFVAQEALERIAAGGSPVGLVDERALWAGLAAQVAVAGSLALAVRWARRAVRPLRARAALSICSLPASTAGPPRPVPAGPRVRDRFEPRSRRGPPAIATA
jgi:hypothetical protein